MRNEEKMSIDERRKYLKLVAPRYGNSNKAERNCLLMDWTMYVQSVRTNPRQLREEIYQAVERLWQFPASNTSTSNTKETISLR